MPLHDVTVNEFGQVTSQSLSAYEVRFSTFKTGEKWRRPHTVLVLCRTIEEAIAAIKGQYPDDPQLHQIVLRNRDMPVFVEVEVV